MLINENSIIYSIIKITIKSIIIVVVLHLLRAPIIHGGETVLQDLYYTVLKAKKLSTYVTLKK